MNWRQTKVIKFKLFIRLDERNWAKVNVPRTKFVEFPRFIQLKIPVNSEYLSISCMSTP